MAPSGLEDHQREDAEHEGGRGVARDAGRQVVEQVPQAGVRLPAVARQAFRQLARPFQAPAPEAAQQQGKGEEGDRRVEPAGPEPDVGQLDQPQPADEQQQAAATSSAPIRDKTSSGATSAGRVRRQAEPRRRI